MTGMLFRHLLESTLLCVLFGFVAICLPRQRASVRHAIWLISLLKFWVPTVLLEATGAWMAFVLPATAWVSSLAAKFSAVMVSLFGIWPSHFDASDTRLTSFGLLAIWAFGSLVMFAAWFHRLRISNQGLTASASEEREALQRAKRRIDFCAKVQLSSSAEGKAPALVGIFRPVVTIPRGLSQSLTVPELEAVLLHELAHARRRDNLASAFVHCLVCLFWFHPLLWFVEKRLIAERERACDEMVVECGTIPRIYLAGLAKVCRFHLFGDVAGMSAMDGSDLKTRFDQILSYSASQPIPHVLRLGVAILAMAATILPVAGGYCEQCVSNAQATTGTSVNSKIHQ